MMRITKVGVLVPGLVAAIAVKLVDHSANHPQVANEGPPAFAVDVVPGMRSSDEDLLDAAFSDPIFPHATPMVDVSSEDYAQQGVGQSAHIVAGEPSVPQAGANGTPSTGLRAALAPYPRPP